MNPFSMSLTLIATIATIVVEANETPATPRIVAVRKIWDKAPHNAFTDLIRFQGHWYCVFREASAHISADGALRIITSRDGGEWTSAARLTKPDVDLRDPHLTATPKGRLMLIADAEVRRGKMVRHQSYVWFSKDARKWSQPLKIGEPDIMLWRVTWHKGVARGVGYSTVDSNHFIRLYESRDGSTYSTRVAELFTRGYPNETSLVFLKDDTALCLLRRDGGRKTAQLGSAKPPYQKWTWKDLGKRLGGPHLIQLPDGRLLAAGRLYDGRQRTSLCWIDPGAGTLTECLTLPSGGDTSYPGLVWHRGLLWISYYSAHEGKASIYLAKVSIDEDSN